MSRVESRGSNQINDLANITIASELESRLKELERNIAVARQFIKLADESYARIRHEWDLLQQDIRIRKTEPETPSDKVTQEGETLEHSQFATSVETKGKTKPRTTKTRNHESSTLTKPFNSTHRSEADTTTNGASDLTHESDKPGLSRGKPRSKRPRVKGKE